MRQLLFCVFMIVFASTYAQDAWQQVGDFPVATREVTSFSLENSAYVLVKSPTNADMHVYAYDVVTDNWLQKADFPINSANHYYSFVLNDEGYILCYDMPDFPTEFYLFKYNEVADQWEQKTSAFGSISVFSGFPGATFSINNKGYLLTVGGEENFQEYDPISDSWSQKADYPSSGDNDGGQLGFTLGGKGYFVLKSDGFGDWSKDLWEYDPVANSWLQKADFPINYRTNVSFTIGDYAYVGMSVDVLFTATFYRYSSSSDTWEQIEDCGYTANKCFGFSIGDYGYVGLGYNFFPSNVTFDDVWKLDPDLLSVVDNERNTKILLYPNPSEDTLSLYGMDAEVGYEIYNLSGGLISEGKTFNKSLDVSSLAIGVYILKITSEEKSMFKKFVKN